VDRESYRLAAGRTVGVGAETAGGRRVHAAAGLSLDFGVADLVSRALKERRMLLQGGRRGEAS
jgi:hypothetical protein